MKSNQEKGRLTKQDLEKALALEQKSFLAQYQWLEEHFPLQLFQESCQEEMMLIVDHLIHFPQSGYFSHIQFKHRSIVLSLDAPEADVKILELFHSRGIRHYQSFISSKSFSSQGVEKKLKITMIQFTQIEEEPFKISLDDVKLQLLYQLLKVDHPELTLKTLKEELGGIHPSLLIHLSEEELPKAVDLYLRAKTRDHCQYHLEDGRDERRLLLAWKNTPKHRFLYRVAKVVFRHHLSMNDVNISYVHPLSKGPVLLMSCGLRHVKKISDEQWADFLKELVQLKYFTDQDTIEKIFVDSSILTGSEANFLRCLMNMVHQTLLHADLNLYSLVNIEEGFCRHTELTKKLVECFHHKLHPQKKDLDAYETTKSGLIELIQHLDTGQEVNDNRRKSILFLAINIIHHILKTNYFRKNKSALSFRLHPGYLDHLPFDRVEKFPELPFGIFYIQGMHFLSFHVRFKDIARGGLRSVIPKQLEQMQVERNHLFAECYNLSYTQQKKNKDIPEGGSKAVILLEPFERLSIEKEIFQKELLESGFSELQREEKLKSYDSEQRLEYLYQAQRAFVHSLLTLINMSEDHVLRAKDIVDEYGKPEYIYLGPDENMYNEMIEWIAQYSVKCHYSLGKAFISSKPKGGINHKEYGVTSLGVNVYMEEVLSYLDIDPNQDVFTIKMTGGPDGDVAGNQLLNLYKYYPKTAKLLALIDGSGTMFDPEGFDLKILVDLFKQGKPLAFYPPSHLHDGGFLLNTLKKKEEGPYAQKTLFCEKKEGKVNEKWISSSEMNHLLRHTVHQTKAQIFIPAGGRPRTLNQNNIQDFLDEKGLPTSLAIVEGANLYLTKEARVALENLGVLIIKDSSSNKGGVICSSLEVLTALTMSEEDFIQHKEILMPQILEHIKHKAKQEAQLLLRTHAETGAPLTEISDLISERINGYTYSLLDYFSLRSLSHDPKNPLMKCLVNYCLPYLREHAVHAILHKIPDMHQKAMISCYIASNLVYKKGLSWAPSIVDILPLLSQELEFLED